MTEYVLQDRTTADKWAITVQDGQLNIATTANAASSEPIFEDKDAAGTYWKLFVDDGQIAVESTATVQDDSLVLEDTMTAEEWTFEIKSGQLFLNNGAVEVLIVSGIVPILRRRRR